MLLTIRYLLKTHWCAKELLSILNIGVREVSIKYIPEPSRFLLALLELDSDIKVTTLDSVFRENYHRILPEYRKRNYNGIERYLGDDDILGIQSLAMHDLRAPVAIQFTGIWKLDRYEYRITIEPLGEISKEK